jgi:hypothetical protein
VIEGAIEADRIGDRMPDRIGDRSGLKRIEGLIECCQSHAAATRSMWLICRLGGPVITVTT